MDNGYVLVMSEWDDGAAHMLWLDSNYPPDADPSKPGVSDIFKYQIFPQLYRVFFSVALPLTVLSTKKLGFPYFFHTF